MKRTLLLFLAILMTFFLVACGAKRTNFDFKFDQVEIQNFLDIVCENTDVESAQVEEVEYYEYLGDYYYNTILMVKPRGMVSEEVNLRFYNSDDSDDVASILIYYYENDSENEINCKDAVVQAVEVSLSGSSKAKEYTDKFSSVSEESQVIASYSLTSEANVQISCRNYWNEWTGKYYIYKN